MCGDMAIPDKIYAKFDKYFNVYETTTVKKNDIPSATVLRYSYGKVFELSSKINSLVERIHIPDLQDSKRMEEKLSKASEICTNLENLADARVNKEKLRGEFVNFWYRLGNALLLRGWLTGGERGVELAEALKAHILKKQYLIKIKDSELSKVLDTYNPKFKPRANQENLLDYSISEDFKRHAKTARIYYNSNQLAESDALRIVFQREPTNIAMGANQYNEENLEKLFGYKKGVYNDLSAIKADGSSFKDLPNSATIYSETYLWDPPGGKNKKEIACLSLSAPALDSSSQPHYEYYMKAGSLDSEKYEQEMKFLFKSIEKTVRDNKDSAFNGKGIKRLVLTRFGQGAFLGALSNQDREIARNAYKQQMAIFLERIKDTGLEVVMSEYSDPGSDIWHDNMIIGDIINTAQENDLIINAWDPNSAPGNGNDADRSFDGAMGKGSGILLTQTSWLNMILKSLDSLVAVI